MRGHVVRVIAACGVLVTACVTSASQAASLFNLDGSVQTPVGGGFQTSTGTASTNNLLDFLDQFQNRRLQNTFSGYTSESAATFNADLRGVGARLSYDLFSPVLRLQIPEIGVDERFTGTTRDESQDMLRRWFQGQGRGALRRLLQRFVSDTPTDPVAGNPNSLMSIMTGQDFSQATGIGGLPTSRAGSGGGGQYEVGFRYGTFSVGAYDQETYTLPLAYRHDLSNGDAIIIDSPLTFSQTNSAANAYSGTLGLAYGWRVPLPATDLSWTVTPGLRLGAVGSTDIGGAAAMWSASLTSTLTFNLEQLNRGLSVTVGNMIGRLQTIPFSAGNFDLSYDLQNWSYRNGLQVTQRVGEWLGRPVDLSAYVVDTRFSGSRLYIGSFQEYGVFASMGSLAVGALSFPVRLGVNYYHGKNEFSGFGVTMGASF